MYTTNTLTHIVIIHVTYFVGKVLPTCMLTVFTLIKTYAINYDALYAVNLSYKNVPHAGNT